MEPHEWLTFFHVLAAIVWGGAVIVTNAAVLRAILAADRTGVLRVTRELQWMGPWLIGPSALVVIGLGIWLVVIEDWASFSQLWIWPTLVLVAVSMILGISSGPEGTRISRLADERGAEDGEVRRRLSRVVWLDRLDMLMLVVVAHGAHPSTELRKFRLQLRSVGSVTYVDWIVRPLHWSESDCCGGETGDGSASVAHLDRIRRGRPQGSQPR